MSFNLDDYQTVDTRLDEFFAKYPEGSIQSELVEHTDSRVTVRALAYRSPSDLVPGIGLSSLAIPGSTPYTRGSELENAETSARGRALVALGFGTKASRDEIQAKAGASSSAPQGQATAAAVSQADHQAPAAAAPSIPYVEKAQEAAQALRASQRPDVPRPTDRLTPKGDRILEAVTFVKRKPDKATKDGRPIYVFDVVLEGVAEEMTTMSERTRDDAVKNENSTARVEFVESGRFKNLWGVHPIESFDGADFISELDEVPF